MIQRAYFCGNPVVVGAEIERRVLDGWVIDPQSPLAFMAFGDLECEFIRNPNEEQLRRDAEPKLTRAEILTRARAAKADKNKEDTPDEY